MILLLQSYLPFCSSCKNLRCWLMQRSEPKAGQAGSARRVRRRRSPRSRSSMIDDSPSNLQFDKASGAEVASCISCFFHAAEKWAEIDIVVARHASAKQQRHGAEGLFRSLRGLPAPSHLALLGWKQRRRREVTLRVSRSSCVDDLK